MFTGTDASTARLLTATGLGAMVFGYFLLPWGDGDTFFTLRGDVFGERWEGADFNRKMQEAFGIWGFLLLLVLGIVAVVLVRRETPARRMLITLALLLAGGAVWHQGMIGTVNGLNLFSHFPQVGAAISAVGLLIGRRDT